MSENQLEPGSLEHAADPYADFNEVQLRSTLKAKDIELERLKQMHTEKQTSLGTDLDAYKKKIGELESTVKAQLATIGDQHDTLNAREKVVDGLREKIGELEQADDMPAGGVVGATVGFYELTTALQSYAVRLAQISSDQATALTAVHLLQLVGQIEHRAEWEKVYNWLVTGRDD